ncbi:MAG: YihY/virulence factor BrkB family protein [Actinobacteria bacterium]|nr:YihY/virulence factor BrkB family protein [Actinomycetota bacterium]
MPDRPDVLAGRRATTPTDIPREGWRQVAVRVKDEIKDDNVALMAGGVVFYAMLAIFPALIAAMTLWGLLADPATIQDQVASFTGGLPAGAASIIEQQVTEATSGDGRALGWGFAISLLGALWTASSGMKGLINATNTAYDEEETRSFLKLRGLALGLTFLGIVFMLFTLSLVAIVPAVLGTLGLGSLGETLVQWGRWPVLAVAVMTALSVLYRYAADRDEPKWRWTTPGSVIGTVVWLLASAAFALYVSLAGRESYVETYGALAGVIILMLWLFLTAFSVLLGAEINAELEHQTRRDTTSGRPRPRGSRDAYVADHVPDRDREESRR